MTRYAIDETRGELVAAWDTGHGALAISVACLPGGLASRQRLAVAASLSGLSQALWRCYTHPASAALSFEPNSEGWRRQQTRDAFRRVVTAMAKPNLPDDEGNLIVFYDPVEEGAHRVGRALHAAADAGLSAAVTGDVEAELQAVERAEVGDLSGRAVQAVELTREDASPVQVVAADRILHDNPLAADDLFGDLEPTAACVAAAHWLQAAADVVAELSDLHPTQVVIESDNISALPHQTPTAVLEAMDMGLSPKAAVTSLIAEAMNIAEGYATDLDTLHDKIDEAEELTADDDSDDEDETVDPDEIRVRLTTLDPRRPAPDMLEDLIAGIHGCRLLYTEYADLPDTDDDPDDEFYEQTTAAFVTAVRERAAADHHRLS